MKNSNRLKGLVMLTVVLVLALFLSVGCGDSDTTHNNDQAQIALYAVHSTPFTNLDPSAEHSNGVITLNNIYETLLKYEPLEDKFVPILATDYEKSDDGMTWVFNIREGVKFHDGTELDADAVKFSIERTMELGLGPAFIWDSVNEIVKKDDYIVEFRLKYPAPIDLIASSAYGAFIMSPTAVKSNPDDWLSRGNAVGTGPYKLERFTIGEEVVLTKHEDYWRGWDDSKFDKVVIKKISEAATRRQLLEKGEADVVDQMPYEDLEALESNPDIEIVSSPSFENMMIFFNTKKSPLDDKLVRKALSQVFPYGDVVKYALGNYGAQARGPIPQGMWGHGDDLLQYEFDLDKAKGLLEQAGYPDGGLKLLFTYVSGDECQKKAAELYKSELQKLNIELEIRGMPWETQWEMSKNKDPQKRQDLFVVYWWPDVVSPFSYLYTMFHSEEEVAFNYAYFENDEVDNLLEEGNIQSAVDKDLAAKISVDIQRILVEEAPAIFAFDKQYAKATHSSFKGYKENPAYANVVFFYDTYREK